MYVLKSIENEPILVCRTSLKGDGGFYIEINEKDVPEKFKIEKLGGSAVIKGDYMRSNTYGITLGKYFKKIAGELIPSLEKFENLKFTEIKDNWNKCYSFLKETDKNNEYHVVVSRYEDEYDVIVRRKLESNEIDVLNHPFQEYKNIFLDKYYTFEIVLKFEDISKEQADNIFNNYSDRRKIFVDLEALNDLVKKCELKLKKAYLGQSKQNFC